MLNKDILFSIAMELDMPALLNFCVVNKNINEKICENKYVWLAKLKKDFSFIFDDYRKDEDPKLAYKFLYNLKNKKFKSDVRIKDQPAYQAATLGSLNFFRFSLGKIEKTFPNLYFNMGKRLTILNLEYGLYGAIESQNLNFVMYFVIDRDVKITLPIVKKAILTKNLEIVEFLYRFITPIEDRDPNKLLETAGESGDKRIVDFLIQQGANDFDEGLLGAVKSKSKDLFDYFISKGADNWNTAFIVAIENNNKDAIEMLYPKIDFPFLRLGYITALQSKNQILFTLQNLIIQERASALKSNNTRLVTSLDDLLSYI